MARVIILGSAGAVNDASHDYTHFILVGDSGTSVLVDAGSNPLGKIESLGIDANKLQDVILTHFHPDHVSGVPNMLMHMWQSGRKAPMRFYGIPHCIDRVEDMMGMYGAHDWPHFFPVSFQRVAYEDDMLLLENDDFLIRSYPVSHFIPTIGMRITNKHTGKVLAYSCDTEPCDNILEIAQGADILIHEAGGFPPGHSTARMAGGIATQSGAKELHLIHYQLNHQPSLLVEEAAQVFDGVIHLCEDFDELQF